MVWTSLLRILPILEALRGLILRTLPELRVFGVRFSGILPVLQAFLNPIRLMLWALAVLRLLERSTISIPLICQYFIPRGAKVPPEFQSFTLRSTAGTSTTQSVSLECCSISAFNTVHTRNNYSISTHNTAVILALLAERSIILINYRMFTDYWKGFARFSMKQQTSRERDVGHRKQNGLRNYIYI